MRIIAPILAGCIALGGCANGNVASDFACKAEAGVPCRSIAETDNGGSAKGRVVSVTEQPADQMLKTLSQRDLTVGKRAGYSAMPDGGHGYSSARYRVPEVLGRLWMAPYLDRNEVLHESASVHFVVAESYWVER